MAAAEVAGKVKEILTKKFAQAGATGGGKESGGKGGKAKLTAKGKVAPKAAKKGKGRSGGS